ncbi:hypothetical protein JCM8097_009399 [Rhodosporidiobolus ruineniae]
MSALVECPICEKYVPEASINLHLDFCSGPEASPEASTSATPVASALKASGKPAAASGGPYKKRKTAADPPPSSSPADKKPRLPIASSSSTTKGPAIPSFRSSSVSKPKAQSARAATTASHLEKAKPLPELVRPRALEDFIGQEHLLGKGALLRSLIEADSLGSCLFWGPPGTGKTTLARVIAKTTSFIFKELSATSATTAQLREVFTEAENVLKLTGRKTLLFIDEIQRFNKAQQDAFLPVVEAGTLSLVSSTTENPSFRVNTALLSRCRVFVLNKLSSDDLTRVLVRALRIVHGLPPRAELDASSVKPELDDTSEAAAASPAQPPSAAEPLADPASSLDPFSSASSSEPHATEPLATDPLASDPVFARSGPLDLPLLRFLASAADGDARVALSSLELALAAVRATPPGQTLDKDELKKSLRKAHLQYDRNGENHYDTISALHKSVRGGDADAALYWLARMLEGGEDPLYVARRCVRMASEDVGLANPQALPQALAAYQATQLIGMPECDCILAQTVVMLAESPKSVRTYKAYNAAKKLVNETENFPVPLHIRNAPTGLMKSLGYGRDYRYNPGYAHPVYQPFLPPELASRGHFLQDDDSVEGKTVDEAALREWEWKNLAGGRWEGREEMERKVREVDERAAEREKEGEGKGKGRASGT